MEDELKHFGVLGMKWGVRRNSSKTYAKASKKLSKLDKKVERKAKKVDKAIKSYNRNAYGFSVFGNEKKATAKVGKAQYKQEKAVAKADKWVKSMRKEFSKVDMNLTAEDSAKGANYISQLNNLKNIKLNKLYG